MEIKMIVLSSDQLKTEIRNVLQEEFLKWKQEITPDPGEKLFYINQVAKRLGKNHGTIKKLCRLGIIKTTKSGLITENAINEYLGKT